MEQTTSPQTSQNKLERHLLDTNTVTKEQLSLAHKFQKRERGPLLMILWKLNFISSAQFDALIDWGVSA
jgi:Protein of unknown function (DUF2949)